MVKTQNQRLVDDTFKALKRASKVLAWNVDHSFAKLMLPVIEAYIKDAPHTIDMSYRLMNRLEYKYCDKLDQKQKKTKLYTWIKTRREKQYLEKLNNIKEAFVDMQNEDTEVWEKKWGIKPLLDVKFDNVSVEPKTNKEKEYAKKHGKLSILEIRPEYKENDKKNSKIIKCNLAREKIYYKWRNKQLKSFIEELPHLWY
jgi:ABC-type Fe3+/spermidine/putrescine transport system ATPase subunit